MKVDAILKKISENANELSSELLEDANQKVAKLQQDSQAKVAELKEKTIKQIAEESEQMRKQMESMADLEYKKYVLSKKRSLIDEAFDKASEKLKNVPLDSIKEKIVSMILSLADGGNTLYVGENSKEWYTDDILEKINAELKKANKTSITKADEVYKNATGAVLVLNGVETHCTLEAVLKNIRSDIENEVAQKLFN